MTFLWFSLNLLNADLDVSLSPSLLLPIPSMTPLFLMLFLNSVLNILTIRFTFPLIICFARINLLFFFSLFELANSGIPIWFRCFKGKHNPQAYSFDIIKNVWISAYISYHIYSAHHNTSRAWQTKGLSDAIFSYFSYIA